MINSPVKNKVPPMALIQYIGMISETVSKKFPYTKVPSGLNCFHILACVKPATYRGKAYIMIPRVPIQKWKLAKAVEYNFDFTNLGINQYTIPNVKNPFQAKAPT